LAVYAGEHAAPYRVQLAIVARELPLPADVDAAIVAFGRRRRIAIEGVGFLGVEGPGVDRRIERRPPRRLVGVIVAIAQVGRDRPVEAFAALRRRSAGRGFAD
jgi:hypothetical protein